MYAGPVNCPCSIPQVGKRVGNMRQKTKTRGKGVSKLRRNEK